MVYVTIFCLQLILKQIGHTYFDMTDMCTQNKVYPSTDLSKSKTCSCELKIKLENNSSLK